MNQRVNLFLVVSIALAIVVLLVIGEYGGKYFFSEKPFVREIKRIDGVTGIKADNELSRSTKYQIRLSKAADWQSCYQQIQGLAERYQISAQNLEYIDTRDDKLKEQFQSLNFSIQEAVQRGTFNEMKEKIAAQLPKSGITDYQLAIDNERIYLALFYQGRELYEIIERGGFWNEKGI